VDNVDVRELRRHLLELAAGNPYWVNLIERCQDKDLATLAPIVAKGARRARDHGSGAPDMAADNLLSRTTLSCRTIRDSSTTKRISRLEDRTAAIALDNAHPCKNGWTK
jgi:hypothetical protein